MFGYDVRAIISGRSPGFTLLEMGIVVVVLALMMGGIMSVVTQNSRLKNQAVLKKRMDAIEASLINFRKKNNRLPCPGNFSSLTTAADFGVESSIPGTCTGGAISVNRNEAGGTVQGGVPVKTLALPTEYAFDPWGNRFTYTIDKRISGTDSFTTYPPNNTTIGYLTIKDAAGNTITSTAVAVLVSHGPNGHGSAQATYTFKTSLSANANELENCDCDTTNGSPFVVTLDRDFVYQTESISAGAQTTVFDDTIRYYTRSQFTSASEILYER